MKRLVSVLVAMAMMVSLFALASSPAQAAGTIWYVDADATGSNDGTSWADAFNYLQDALAVAQADDQIWVAEGTYKPDENTANPTGSDDRAATFQLINGVAIYGGFSGIEASLGGRNWEIYETILSGDLAGDDGPDFANNDENSRQVVTGSDTDETVTLDGFTITAGNADGIGGPHHGGGMYNTYGSPTVTNCTFSGNYAAHSGGGMYNERSSPVVTNCTFSGNSVIYGGGGMYNHLGSPVVTNCAFSGNSAEHGGGMNNSGSSTVVTNCTFSGNSASAIYGGGGMYNEGCNPVVTNCTFSGNSADSDFGRGGGMCNTYDSNPVVTNCAFSSNSAIYGGGGMYNNRSGPVVTNCTFSGNSARNGGGMHNYERSSPEVTNCTFSGNSARTGGGMNNDHSLPVVTNCTFSGNSGGGMYSYVESPVVTNCILWGDTPDEIDGTPSVTYSNVQGGYTGTGNIDADPLFADADLRLAASSPCIDTGDNSAVPPGVTTDLDGNTRITDGDGDTIATVDMGAYEHPAVTTPTPLPDLVVSSLSEEWVEEGATYNVTFTICNTGSSGAGASVAGIYIDGSWQQDQAVGALNTSQCSGSIMVGSFTISGESDTIEIRADNDGAVTEANEQNNSAQSSMPPPPSNGEGAGCFIATAAYGSYLDSHVETLRDFRDSYMVTNPAGKALVSAYYKVSPPVAEFIDDHPTLKPIVRVGLLPAVAMSTVAVSTTLAQKVAIVGSLALVSVALAVWLSRRRGKGVIS